jgi:hypothetical protein
MPDKYAVFTCILALSLLSGCKKGDSAAASVTPAPTVGPAKFDACTLLKPEEVGQLQGATIKDSIRSGQSNGKIEAAQCYYSAAEPNMSVSVAVTLNDPNTSDKNATREYWEQTFARAEKEGENEAEKEKRESLEKQSQRGEEEEEGHRPPLKRVEGLGEQAYWSGSRVGGALYTLKKNSIVRVSVGGPGDEAHKMEKSKALAQKALERLP